MYESLVSALVNTGARVATKYLSERDVVKVTRRAYRSRKTGKRSFDKRVLELTITRGRPNYLEREFIRRCKAAGEPFPVRKIQLRFAPAG